MRIFPIIYSNHNYVYITYDWHYLVQKRVGILYQTFHSFFLHGQAKRLSSLSVSLLIVAPTQCLVKGLANSFLLMWFESRDVLDPHSFHQPWSPSILLACSSLTSFRSLSDIVLTLVVLCHHFFTPFHICRKCAENLQNSSMMFISAPL
jgi:hypothetical protein